MEYTSFIYIIFILISLLFYYLLPKKCQWAVLLVASLVFYVIFSEALVLVMLASTLLVYLGGLKLAAINSDVKAKKKELERPDFKAYKKLGEKKKKSVLTVIVVLELAFIGVLKYGNFFGSLADSFLTLFTHKSVIPTFNLIVPLGISYYTLMCISYITDVYRGTIKAERNFFKILLFVCYFPHIIEGPFDRYDALGKQFSVVHKFDYDKFKNGALLLMFGMFKKLVIADRAGIIASGIFDGADELGGTAIALGVLVYTLQLYADFSGCIEIVSGTSEMFGIQIAENFRQPFFSRSVGEFWRRWHITLGAWLKDYVFYPAAISGGFKKVNAFAKDRFKSENLKRVVPAAYALFFVWFCNGLWHGTSGKYIVYGLYYYVIMMLGEFTKPMTDKLLGKVNREGRTFKAFQLCRTFLLVNLGMLIFRSTTLGECAKLLGRIFTSVNFKQLFDGSVVFDGLVNWDWAILIIGIAVMLIIGIIKEKGTDVRAALDTKPLALRWAVYIVLIFATIIFGIYGGNFENAGMIYAEF